MNARRTGGLCGIWSISSQARSNADQRPADGFPDGEDIYINGRGETMIKATMKTAGGRTVLMIGLSFANLAKFRASPLDTFIPINGDELGLEKLDIMIMSGQTEDEITGFFRENGFFGPKTAIKDTSKKRR